MDNLKQVAKDFYEQHVEFLKQNYPGIRITNFEQELSSFLNLRAETDSLIIDGKQDRLISEFFSNVLKGVPFQYINGKAFFFNSEFNVSPAVLIPRFETEFLVEKVLEDLELLSVDRPKIVDVGTGSGNIIITILQESKRPLKAWALDCSEAALEIAKSNAFLLQFSYSSELSLQFVLGDRLENVSTEIDLIVSNPPYIKKCDQERFVHSQVTKFEPHEALFVEDQIYEKWYFDFFSQAKGKLKSGGLFWLEGHEENLEELKLLAERLGFESEIQSDLTRRPRFLRLKKE